MDRATDHRGYQQADNWPASANLQYSQKVSNGLTCLCKQQAAKQNECYMAKPGRNITNYNHRKRYKAQVLPELICLAVDGDRYADDAACVVIGTEHSVAELFSRPQDVKAWFVHPHLV